MLEEIEMRFILTDADGKLLGCYAELENAEMDAKDMVGERDTEFILNIYELMNGIKIGEPYLQNTYELRKSFPEAEEEEQGETESSE
jgi:hypothetical protein